MENKENSLLRLMAEEIAKSVEAEVEYIVPFYFIYIRKLFGRKKYIARIHMVTDKFGKHPIVLLDKGSPLEGLDLSRITKKYVDSLGRPIPFIKSIN